MLNTEMQRSLDRPHARERRDQLKKTSSDIYFSTKEPDKYYFMIIQSHSTNSNRSNYFLKNLLFMPNR